jgi:segregation and condensation protein B
LESGNNHQPIIEALLFASEKPLPADRIQAIMKDITPEQIEEAVEALNEKYRNGGHSIAIKKVAKGYRIYTIPDYAEWVKALFSHNRKERLTPQALEVLSIVAYKQPIVKSEIDLIRGVNSEGPVFTLLDRKLITIVGRKPAPGRPLLYGTTKEFLTHFGLNDVEDLPRMEELEIILKRKEAPSFAEEIYDNLSNDQQPDDNGEIPPDVSSGDPEIPMNHSEQVSPEVPSEDENK